MKNKFLIVLSFLLLNSGISFAAQEVIAPSIESGNKQGKNVTKRRVSIKAMALGVTKASEAITKDPFSEESVWDQGFLNRDEETKLALKKFLDGTYGQKLKNLNLSSLSRQEIEVKLTENGFTKREADGRVDGLLGRSKDREFQDSGEIYVSDDGSMVRIKDYSKNRKQRPQAYIVKAVLKNPTGPVTWQNEAFKVTKEGYPVPKGPKQNHGMKIHAPNSSSPDEDRGWIDLIMEEVHIDIK